MENKLGKKCSNLRKRHSEDQQASSSGSQSTDTGLTSTGRPKRKCTLNQKKNYLGSDPTKESANQDNNKKYVEISKPLVHNKKVPTTRTTTSGTLMITDRRRKNKSPTRPDLTDQKANYKWIEHDIDTGKVRCRICMASNMNIWFIIATENNDNLTESFRLHEESEQHQHAFYGVLLSNQKMIFQVSRMRPKLHHLGQALWPVPQ